jgi:hypothetical protein
LGIWGNPTSFGGPRGSAGVDGPAGPATAATLVFTSDATDSGLPSSGYLPVYDGIHWTDVLTLTAPAAGSYWVSLTTQLYYESNTVTPVQGECEINKNSQNFALHANQSMQIHQTLL